MADVRTLGGVIRDWYKQRPEFSDKSTEHASLIVKTITMEEALASLQASVTQAMGAIERKAGRTSVRVNGHTTWKDPVGYQTIDEFIFGYLKDQLGRAQADVRKAWERTCEWVEAHPELGMTAKDVWAQAHGPEWAIG